VAIDAERASGYRYGQRAYLVQVRREGSGTALIDPMAVPDLAPLNTAINGAEWILHAATQDLACLAEVGLRPKQLFDTELAARLLGMPRVGLAAVVEHYLGLTLAKEHSAVDWSTRPLPTDWLKYAALDVEVLGEVRNLMGVDLARSGKAEWARQEFAALITWAPAVKVDPWRRTSGLHKVRGARGLAYVRELWFERDRMAGRARHRTRAGDPRRGACWRSRITRSPPPAPSPTGRARSRAPGAIGWPP
jgi:ribonuclease D